MQNEQTDWIAEVVSELPPICNVVEAYTVLRTTRRNIYRLVASGRLHAVRPAAGGSARLLVPRSSIETYLRRLDEAA
jgi:excisionase family DNA binding protein